MNLSFIERYHAALEQAGSSLCVGLDTDLAKIPSEILDEPNPIFAFNRRMIDATSDLACAYKLNLAFYESEGEKGLEALRLTLDAIPDGIITIADAKRGDIGNTAERYAYAIFGELGFDAITVNPYLGMDSLAPFFGWSGRGVFVLALTSNPGSSDFQRKLIGDIPLYRHVIDMVLATYGETGSVGFVVGATYPQELAEIRSHIGDSVPLLVPGLGSQGGSAEATMAANAGGAVFYNVSRGISYPGGSGDPFERIRTAAESYSRLLGAGTPDDARGEHRQIKEA